MRMGMNFNQNIPVEAVDEFYVFGSLVEKPEALITSSRTVYN